MHLWNTGMMVHALPFAYDLTTFLFFFVSDWMDFKGEWNSIQPVKLLLFMMECDAVEI